MMAAQTKPLNVSFKQINKDSIPLVGGKGANLGEIVSAGFPVPDGFAITVHSYDKFLEENNLKAEINAILKEINVNNSEELEKTSKIVSKKIVKSEIPKDISDDIIRFYKNLSGRLTPALVAVRSSATAEDLPGASFAGQQATYLNIKGEANLLIAVRECWASLFTARALFPRSPSAKEAG